MSYQMEELGKNMVKLTIEVESAEVDKALESAYVKMKGQFNLPGFRKGKVPRAMVEKMYGTEIFHEEATNIMVPSAFRGAVENSDIEIVASPEIEVIQLEKGKNFIFSATVAVKPEVKLGQYKGVEVSKPVVEINEEEILTELEKSREMNSRLVAVEDRASQNDDVVIIDFEGSIDGVPFEGGKGEDHALTLGSNSFIDTFEEQLVGKNAGDDVEVNVTFPEEYHAENLKGKPALFKVKIKEIKHKELPELDDEFAAEVSEFDTLEEYKESIRKDLTDKKAKEAEAKKGDEAVEKVIENAEMDIPDAMIEEHLRQMMNDFAYRMQSQGLSMEQYLNLTGTTAEQMYDQMRPQAKKRLESALVLEAVATAENILPTEEDVDKEIEKMAEMYKMDLSQLKEQVSEAEREQIKGDLKLQKAGEIILQSAVEK